MNPCLILSQTVLFLILVTDLRIINEVEAGHKVVSLGNWFGSVEKIKNVDGSENSQMTERLEQVIKKKKIKKRKKASKKDLDWVPEDSGDVVKVVKKKRKKKSGRRNFIRTAVKEFNLTESEEHDKRRKPVDIIVHIKMND